MVNRLLEGRRGLCTANAPQGVHILKNELQALEIFGRLTRRCRLPNFAHILDDQVDSVL